MDDDENEKDEAEEMLDLVFNDLEFDEWAAAGMITPTDEIPIFDNGPDTEDDLPAFSIP